jgi:hypothetical protein
METREEESFAAIGEECFDGAIEGAEACLYRGNNL